MTAVESADLEADQIRRNGAVRGRIAARRRGDDAIAENTEGVVIEIGKVAAREQRRRRRLIGRTKRNRVIGARQQRRAGLVGNFGQAEAAVVIFEQGEGAVLAFRSRQHGQGAAFQHGGGARRDDGDDTVSVGHHQHRALADIEDDLRTAIGQNLLLDRDTGAGVDLDHRAVGKRQRRTAVLAGDYGIAWGDRSVGAGLGA